MSTRGGLRLWGPTFARSGSGAPLRNHNALKHGLYTAEERALKKHITQLIRESRKIIELI